MSAALPIRTERRFGVTATLSPRAMRNLYVLYGSETWNDLLDVMEQVVIEVESELINTDAADEKAVLANHKMSKAAWNMFTHLQEKLLQLTSHYLSSPIANEPVEPLLSEEEMERANTLDPINYRYAEDTAL